MTKEVSSTLAKNLKKIRNSLKLTQDELSDRAGIAYSTVAKLEQGAIKSPSLKTVIALADALSVSVAELATGGTTALAQAELAKPKFIYFDVNGVIVKDYHRALATISRESQMPLDKVEEAYWHFNAMTNRGEISMEEFNKRFSTRLGVAVFDWQKFYLDAAEPIPQMVELIHDLSTHYKLGLLTNAYPGLTEEMLKRKVIPDVGFKEIVISCNEHIVKPDPAIFELAEKKSGFSDSYILLVDDSKENISAAAALNWRGFWFDRYDVNKAVEQLRELLL